MCPAVSQYELSPKSANTRKKSLSPSHYLSVPPDPHRLLSDSVLSSAVLASSRGIRDEAMADITNTGAGGSGGGGFDDLGVDPNLDPELAMVSHT